MGPLPPRSVSLCLLLSACFLVYLAVRAPGGESSAQLRGVASSSGGGAFDAASARVAALAMWSATFGRELRDGTCDTSTRLARTSSHQLLKLDSRLNMGPYLEALGAVGPAVELGVQRAEFTCDTLLKWPNVTAYYLVDPWAHQADYVDLANKDQAAQEQIHNEARSNVEQFLPALKDRVHFVRDFSFNAVKVSPARTQRNSPLLLSRHHPRHTYHPPAPRAPRRSSTTASSSTYMSTPCTTSRAR